MNPTRTTTTRGLNPMSSQLSEIAHAHHLPTAAHASAQHPEAPLVTPVDATLHDLSGRGRGALLDTLGLTTDEYAVYRSIVALGEVDPSAIKDAVGLTDEVIEAAVRRLAVAGLVRYTVGSPVRVQPVDPNAALRPRLSQLTRTAEALGALAEELAEDFYAARRRQDSTRLLEVITGASALRSTLDEVQRHARTEMLWLCKASPVVMPSSLNTEEFRALERGVSYRVIYERALLTEPGGVESAAAGMELGEQARVLPSLPVRLAISDESTVILPLTTTLTPGQEPTAAVIHDSSLTHALVALFEQLWDRATPLERRSESDTGHADQSPLRLDPDDRYLLTLLVSGIPDKAIASQMGVSTRTVQRRVSTLMDSMSVETRVELAYVVGRQQALT